VNGEPLESDRSWVAAFKRGDRAALARVFSTYADDVARQVRATRVAEHDVESLVHDVFVKAFAEKARLGWDGLRPFGAWLNTLTRNVLVDRARRERRLDPRAPDDMPVLVDDRPDAAAHHDDRELTAALQAFRATLDDDEHRLFATRFAAGQSLAQTAKSLGWSEIRVRKVDTGLRARLLDALQAAGFLRQARVRIGTSLLARRADRTDRRDDARDDARDDPREDADSKEG
jgi:RNA polymerase sigma factor (sigma-70 family)